mmetsp:Transcript_15028/g.22514  ORF Transcript_15028/g.22514 Transcript_15028/m.22514 type:complete len:154 (-) Transcript_15028:25-486(-)
MTIPQLFNGNGGVWQGLGMEKSWLDQERFAFETGDAEQKAILSKLQNALRLFSLRRPFEVWHYAINSIRATSLLLYWGTESNTFDQQLRKSRQNDTNWWSQHGPLVLLKVHRILEILCVETTAFRGAPGYTAFWVVHSATPHFKSRFSRLYIQ